MKNKLLLIVIIFLVFSNYGNGQNTRNNNDDITFKSNNYEIYEVDLKNKTLKDSIITVENVINYHTINLNDKKITMIQYNNIKNNWESFDLFFDRINNEEWGTEYIINNNGCLTVSYSNDNSSLLYNLTNGEIYSYNNLVKVENNALDGLNIYKKNDLVVSNNYQQDKILKENNSVKAHVRDFEYSEIWKQKAYQAVITYMQKRIKKSDPNCRIVSRAKYNSNYVRYIGGQTYSIKYYCEFDCNQNYINMSYFYIDATYLGNDHWDLKVTDQQLTH